MKPFTSIYTTTTIANNNSNIPSNLEDVRMDTASSTSVSSSIPICSFDNTTLEQEADKQILEWSSKLELDTIELREKSIILVDIFNKKRDKLNNCIKLLKNLLNGINLQSVAKISEELNAFRNEQILLFKDMTLKFKNIEEQITNLTKIIQSQQSQDKVDSMITNQEKIILSSKNIEWICTNINDQLSQMRCFISLILAELNIVVKRQMKLKERVEQNDGNTAIYLDYQEKRKQVTEQPFNMKTNGKVNGVQTLVSSQSQQTLISKETIVSKTFRSHNNTWTHNKGTF